MATSVQSVSRRDPLGDLRQERDRFVALAFSASDVLFELDRDGCVVFTAGAAGALLGAQAGELIGRTFLDLVTPDDRTMIREALGRHAPAPASTASPVISRGSSARRRR